MEIALSAASLLPSLLAVSLALITRQVFVAMFFGVWVGAFLIEGASLNALIPSLFHVVDTWLMEAIVPKDGNAEHFNIVLFSLITGAMIGVLSHNGGMRGVVNLFTQWADTRSKGQGASFALGGLIFFDDYANTLIVGNTMRPLTDALKISREKLAFIVDSTAAPIACIALITTWVGFQVSLLEDALKSMSFEMSGFALVLGAIPYSFYPILMLVFIAFMIITKRDFGAMLKAERKTLASEPVQDEAALLPDSELLEHKAKPRAWNAIIPIFCYILGTIWGLAETGEGDTMRDILGSADPFKSVLWGALLGLITAIILSVSSRALSISQAMDALESGLRPMMLAVMILTFAWAIADVNTQLKTAEYIVSVIGDAMPLGLLPVIVFVVAALTSFATGSSWSTMGILVPLMLPLVVATLANAGITEISAVAEHPVMLATIASVLTGAVWGDHCSPISDTTILSSMASGCNHIEHVRTQMPYAMTVAGVSIIICLVPVGYGAPWWLVLLIGAGALFTIMRVKGEVVE